MRECVYLGAEEVPVSGAGGGCCGASSGVRRCVCPNQPSEWCLPGAEFEGAVNGFAVLGGESVQLSAVSCQRCEHKAVPVVLQPRRENYKTHARRLWEQVHYMEDRKSTRLNSSH